MGSREPRLPGSHKQARHRPALDCPSCKRPNALVVTVVKRERSSTKVEACRFCVYERPL